MRKKNIQRLVIAAVLLIVLPFVISQFMLECLTKLFAMDPDQASTIASTGQVIVQALAAVMIIVQLGQDNGEAKQQSEIEAARFLFQYNQSFLEDENVIEIERLIDKEYMDEIDGIPRTNSVINNTNRQYVVNYLVYLEGLAPLVLNGTLKLEVIDDLMSYRFFLAVNNPEIQKKILGEDAEIITCRPADLLEPELGKLEKEMAQWKQQDEDVLTYALFPQVAVDFFKYREAQQTKVDQTVADTKNGAYPV